MQSNCGPPDEVPSTTRRDRRCRPLRGLAPSNHRGAKMRTMNFPGDFNLDSVSYSVAVIVRSSADNGGRRCKDKPEWSILTIFSSVGRSPGTHRALRRGETDVPLPSFRRIAGRQRNTAYYQLPNLVVILGPSQQVPHPWPKLKKSGRWGICRLMFKRTWLGEPVDSPNLVSHSERLLSIASSAFLSSNRLVYVWSRRWSMLSRRAKRGEKPS